MAAKKRELTPGKERDPAYGLDGIPVGQSLDYSKGNWDTAKLLRKLQRGEDRGLVWKVHSGPTDNHNFVRVTRRFRPM
jgi:hypothetical protein